MAQLLLPGWGLKVEMKAKHFFSKVKQKCWQHLLKRVTSLLLLRRRAHASHNPAGDRCVTSCWRSPAGWRLSEKATELPPLPRFIAARLKKREKKRINKCYKVRGKNKISSVAAAHHVVQLKRSKQSNTFPSLWLDIQEWFFFLPAVKTWLKYFCFWTANLAAEGTMPFVTSHHDSSGKD